MLFWPYSGWEFLGLLVDGGGAKRSARLAKIFHRYPTMMKLGTVIPYLKKTQKIYESRETTPDLCWHQHFFTGIRHTLLCQEIQRNTDLNCILIHNFEVFSLFLLNLVIILMMSAKMATQNLHKLTVFWNEGYGVLNSVDDVINKILWHDSNYIVDLFMWPKFGNSSISMKEVITSSIL